MSFKMPSKALFYRDWKYSRWFMIPIVLELMFFFIPPFVQEVRMKTAVGGFNDRAAIYMAFYFIFSITLSIMSVTLFYYERNVNLYSLSASMPFKKAEIIRSKWLVGLYNITLPYFFVYLLLNAIMICNFCWKDYFINTSKWFVVSLLTAYFIYGFIIMVQSINGSAVSGSLATILFALCPLTILYTLFQVLYKHYSLQSLYAITNQDNSPVLIPDFLKGIVESRVIEDIVNAVFSLFNISTTQKPLPSPFAQTDSGFFFRAVFFLVFILLFYYLSKKIFVKSKYEKSGCLISSTAYERVCRAVISYLLGFMALVIYSMLTSSKTAFRLDFAIVFCLVLPILIYYLSGVALKLNSRQTAMNKMKE